MFSISSTYRQQNIDSRRLRELLIWLLWYGCMMAVTAGLAFLLYKRGPTPSVLGWLLLAGSALAILYRPRYGIYLTVFFALVGDGSMIPWYPFVKNFSSYESMLFLHDAIIISPLEMLIALTFLGWIGRDALQRKINFRTTALFWPAMVFLGFMIVGLIYGLGTGGNLNIAMWELRPIIYLIAMIVLASNLLEERQQVINLIWFAMAALLIEGLIGTYTYLFVLKGELSGVNSMTDHSAALHLNTVFIFAIAGLFYGISPGKQLVLLLMVPPVLLTFIAAQRRAAILTLLIALGLMFLLLLLEKRHIIWVAIPPLVVMFLIYLVLFWNQEGVSGMAAQAIKSVIAPEQANIADQSSNVYREIENFNLTYTLHRHPLTGVGFGQTFEVIVPLPDISFFTWWNYLPHNSIVYIWLKGGIGGFVSMLFLVSMAISLGARAVRRMPHGEIKAIALTACLYLVMHFTYAYVDISWDAQSMVYIGSVMGMLSGLEAIIARPVSLPRKRWPWQSEPKPAPQLIPLPGGKQG